MSQPASVGEESNNWPIKDESVCMNCSAEGHINRNCSRAGPEGFVNYCPICNGKHSYEVCHLRREDTDGLYLIEFRYNLPPIKTSIDIRTLPEFCTGYRPHTASFAKVHPYGDGYYYAHSGDCNGRAREVAQRRRDPAWDNPASIPLWEICSVKNDNLQNRIQESNLINDKTSLEGTGKKLEATSYEIAAIEQAHANKLLAINTAHAQKLEATSRDIAAIKEAHANELLVAKTKYDRKLQNAEHVHAKKLLNAEKSHAQELKKTKKAHNKKLSAVNRTHSQDLKKANNAHNKLLLKLTMKPFQQPKQPSSTNYRGPGEISRGGKLSAANKAHSDGLSVTSKANAITNSKVEGNDGINDAGPCTK